MKRDRFQTIGRRKRWQWWWSCAFCYQELHRETSIPHWRKLDTMDKWRHNDRQRRDDCTCAIYLYSVLDFVEFKLDKWILFVSIRVVVGESLQCLRIPPLWHKPSRGFWKEPVNTHHFKWSAYWSTQKRLDRTIRHITVSMKADLELQREHAKPKCC